MKLPAGLFLAACPLLAHVISMSSGDLTIQGTSAHYEFRMPLYEITHIAHAESLFAHIVFASGGQRAQLLQQSCHPDAGQGAYICTAEYRFAAPVDTLDVECTFHAVTVPNHVHLLRVVNGDKHDQALFDISFPRATLRFRPPTALETAVTEAAGGALRAWGGAAQILFLASLVVAARSRRELLLLTGMFLAGQIAAATLVPFTRWQPPARFVEAAAGLTIAYLAVEILVLPKAGMRWLIVGVLGVFHGLYFELFLRTTGYHAAYVLPGAGCAEVALIAACALVFSYLGKLLRRFRPVPVCACLLLVTGMAWFFLRLRN
ncbi:MAG TPA: HupE/UreJ family protein [Bryobacteraceae bacterium]|nr:HupE/UreJ family protein [Bryobacteraceae bacterium]